MINYISSCVSILNNLLTSDLMTPFVGLVLTIWVAKLILTLICRISDKTE